MSGTASPNQEDRPLDWIARIEETILCLLLMTMIVLSCLQISLRSLFASGLLWADPLIQHLVLWSGLMGAAMATARGKHIAIDIVNYLVPEKMQPWVLLLNHLFSALTTSLLTYAAWLFLQSEIEYGAPGLLGVPSWGWNAIFPLAFAVIAIRYYMAVGLCLVQLIRQRR